MERRRDQEIKYLLHEIQNGLQGVIADIANAIDASADEQVDSASQLFIVDALAALHGAEALSVLITTVQGHQSLGEYSFQTCFINELLVKAMRLYAPQARRRDIDVSLQLSDVDTQLELSIPHMQVAINDLLDNAIRYSFRGTPSHSSIVRIKGYVEGNSYALLMENIGIGILTHEIASRDIFRPGYQGSLLRNEYGAHQGLGLYFVKNVIEKHQGDILIESSPVNDSESAMDEEDKKAYLTRVTIRLPLQQPKER